MKHHLPHDNMLDVFVNSRVGFVRIEHYDFYFNCRAQNVHHGPRHYGHFWHRGKVRGPGGPSEGSIWIDSRQLLRCRCGNSRVECCIVSEHSMVRRALLPAYVILLCVGAASGTAFQATPVA